MIKSLLPCGSGKQSPIGSEFNTDAGYVLAWLAITSAIFPLCPGVISAEGKAVILILAPVADCFVPCHAAEIWILPIFYIDSPLGEHW